MGAPRRFSYYDRLSAKDRRTYRKSDAVTSVDLPNAAALHPVVARLSAALEGDVRKDVERAAQALCRGIVEQLGVPKLTVKVRAVRPSDQEGELHGLYTWEEGKMPIIEVWMRTAHHLRVVAFRTFLRTLLHEVCHHLDFTLLGLEETFHTEGFFRRESSLTRQLAGPSRRPRSRRIPEDSGTSSEGPSTDRPGQLRLFS